MPNEAEKHVAGVDVLASGSPLDPTIRDTMLEVRVRDTLLLPSSATLRVASPMGDNIDKLFNSLGIGKDIEIKTSSTGATATKSIFKGQVVAFEPEFGAKGAEIVIRALDKGHKLQRQRKVRTFQQMSAADMRSVRTSNPTASTTCWCYSRCCWSNAAPAFRFALRRPHKVGRPRPARATSRSRPLRPRSRARRPNRLAARLRSAGQCTTTLRTCSTGWLSKAGGR